MQGQPSMGSYGGGMSLGRSPTDSSVPFDASNFPVLQGGGSTGGPAGGGRNWYGGQVPPLPGQLGGGLGREEEFTIHKEDFPALPGSQLKGLGGTAIGRDTANQSSSSGNMIHMSTREGGGGGQNQQTSVRCATTDRSPTLTSSDSNVAQKPPGTLTMGVGFGSGVMSHAPPSPATQPVPTPSSGGEETAPVSQEARYGLLGLLDVVKMINRVSGKSGTF